MNTNYSASCANPQLRRTGLHQATGQSVAELPSPAALWAVLPRELLCNILGWLPFHDLVSCRSLNQRTAEVIQDSLLLPQAYCRQLQPEHLEERFSVEEYDRETRLWLMEAGQSSEVRRLDSLKAHKSFPKVLFYTVSKTMGQAQYWNLEKKQLVSLDEEFQLPLLHLGECLQITPDGRALAFIDCTERALRIVTIQSGNSPTEDFRQAESSRIPYAVRCSPNSKVLAVVYFCGALSLIEKENNCWKSKYQSELSYPRRFSIENLSNITVFSPDSRNFLVTMSRGTLRVVGKQGNSWVPKMEIETHCRIQSAHFVQGPSSIAFALFDQGLTVMDAESEKLVERYQQWDFVHQVSSRGHSLAVGDPDTLAAVLTFKKGGWIVSRMQPQFSEFHCIQFSPDGQHLVISTNDAWYSDKQPNLRVISFDGTANWLESGHIETGEVVRSVRFSPDSNRLFATTLRCPTKFSRHFPSVHAVFTGQFWQFHDTRGSETPFSPAFISPDDRAAIEIDDRTNCNNTELLRFKGGEWWLSKKIRGPNPLRVQFSPDNRKIFLIFKNEVELLEIKPKHCSSRLATGGTT